MVVMAYLRGWSIHLTDCVVLRNNKRDLRSRASARDDDADAAEVLRLGVGTLVAVAARGGADSGEVGSGAGESVGLAERGVGRWVGELGLDREGAVALEVPLGGGDHAGAR